MPILDRRTLLSGLGLVGLAATTTACASDATGDAEAAGGPTPDGGFPVRFDHAFGTTVVETAPRRVAVLGVTDADALLALGVQPLTTTGFSFYPETGVGPWASELLTGTPVRIPSDTEFSIEALAAVAPDLVVAVVSGIDEAMYAQLSRIAPVLARPVGSTDYDNDRDGVTLTVARALGRGPEGADLVATADRRFADAVAANPAFAGRTAVVALAYDGTFGAFTPGDGRGAFLADLGLVLPAALAAEDTGESFFIPVSRERLDLLEADVLLVLTDPDTRAAVQADPVLADLDVSRRGAVLFPDVDLRGALTYNSVLSVPYALDRLVPELARVLG